MALDSGGQEQQQQGQQKLSKVKKRKIAAIALCRDTSNLIITKCHETKKEKDFDFPTFTLSKLSFAN